MGYAIRTRHYAAAPDTPSQENPLRRRGGHDCAADKGHAAMWPGAATILVLLTVSASGARAQSSLPDASTTPGAVNPAVTQKTSGETICIPGWTRMVRPAVGYTEELKRQQMAAFRYHDRRLRSRELRPTVGERTGRTSWSLYSTSSSAPGVYRCQRPSERSRQIGSPPISAMLDQVARPTFRTRAHGEDLLSPDRLVFSTPLGRAGRRGAALLSRTAEATTAQQGGVLRPPPALPHPKAAISASAAWRPTVAGPATGGS